MTDSRDKPVDFELEELIWNGIEGHLDPAGEDRLESWAASDPEAQEIRESYSELAAILDRVEPEMPPPELRREILRSVERRQTSNRSPAPSRIASTSAWRAQWASLAAGFILGAVALYLASMVSSLAGPDPAAVVGTFSLHDVGDELPAMLFELRDEHDRLSLARSGGQLIAEIRLASDDTTRFELQVTRGLQVSRIRHDGAIKSEMRASGTSLDLNLTGPGLLSMVVSIDDPDTGLLLSVSDREGQLVQQEVRWSDLPERSQPNSSFYEDSRHIQPSPIRIAVSSDVDE